MIKGSVVGGDQVVVRLDALPDDIRKGLKNGIGRACLRVLTRTKEKLSGVVLNVRTGRLRRSITRRIEEGGTEVSGIVGTKVEYARPHEFGFKGVVNVREHLRTTVNGAKARVRSHTRNVDIKERSFLRSSLNELQPEVRNDVQQGIAASIRARS